MYSCINVKESEIGEEELCFSWCRGAGGGGYRGCCSYIVLEMEIFTLGAGGCDYITADMLEYIPEDLSVKHRNDSIQTEICLGDKI